MKDFAVLNTDGELVGKVHLPAGTGFRDAVRYARRRPTGHGEGGGLQRHEGRQKASLAQYGERCGVPEAQIIALAETFTHHGRKAQSSSRGGMMARQWVL